MERVTENIVIENAHLLFKNFSGKQTTYNPAGNRNFCVYLENAETAKKLQADGWNVKWFQPREEGDEPQAYIQVSVSYRNIPPTIKLITSNGQSVLDEESVGMLDWADILNVDLIIRPYNWSVNGNSGVKAYVKSMYVTIEEDVFAEKYGGGFKPDEDIPF